MKRSVLAGLAGLLGPLTACGGQSSNGAGASSGAADDADRTDAAAHCIVEHFQGDFAAAKTTCTTACEASSKSSCKALGNMYAGGEGVPKDPARAQELYAKACKLGETAACDLAGTDPAAKLDAAEKECNAGTTSVVKDSCRTAGEAYLDGKGVAIDRARAEPLLKKACQLGSIPACDDFKWSPKK